jgi:hypothetical protein
LPSEPTFPAGVVHSFLPVSCDCLPAL